VSAVGRACTCEGYSQDAGGGYVEWLAEWNPDCPVHGVAASNTRESAYWSDPARAAEWADSLKGPKP